MTRNRILEIFASRGFAAALVTARACREHSLVVEVMLANFEVTGFVRPVPRFARNKRGVVKADSYVEGASPSEIIEVKELHRQRHPKLTPAQPKVKLNQLTLEEKSHRVQALLALMTPNELARVMARQAARRVAVHASV